MLSVPARLVPLPLASVGVSLYKVSVPPSYANNVIGAKVSNAGVKELSVTESVRSLIKPEMD